MEYLGLSALAVAVIAIAWWLSHLLGRTDRNDDGLHGGGLERSIDGD